ncbi:TonB-dependent receptor [Flammeovirga sp. EKP202]|uniref:SusC/RagA family TonB-linked outer membrane protein n=1 Tax=Flammeovirga sp. EKP202 TaxID=2770592 RepID=UPI0016600405|nr:TonB-dependent receptor [Flammeovirga sp. EKP202]MBD0404311.1 TonB-dependent receptor [Flammeovirga sp. EKP202]
MITNIKVGKLFFFILFYLFVIKTVSAQITIDGTVKGEGGVSIPGVNIKVKGAPEGTISGFDGKYKIKVTNSKDVLIYSFIGYKTQEIQVGNQTTINVQLLTDNTTLEEVEVVAIGYGAKVKKKDLTGAVGSVHGEEITKSKATSFMEAMQGRASGVQIVSQSGEPGAGVNINIRGKNSLSMNSQPLYVVDGVQIEVNDGEVASGDFGSTQSYNPLSSINPSDILSVEVLKDASATAIYGSRGANGVMIITTKKGQEGKFNINLDVSHGVSHASKRLNVLDGNTYAAMRFERNPNSTLYGEEIDGIRVPRTFPDSMMVNWQDEAFVQAPIQNYNISFNGGGKGFNYASSFSYLDQQGIIKGTGYDRITGRINVHQKANKSVQLGGNLQFSNSNNNGAALNGGNGDFNGITQAIVLLNPILIDPSLDLEGYETGGLTSPYTMLTDAYKNVEMNRFLATAYMQLNFTKKLRLRATVGTNRVLSEGREFYGKNTSWGRVANGKGIIRNNNAASTFLRNILTYNNNFRRKHNVNAQAAFDIEQYEFKSSLIKTSGYVNEVVGVDDLGFAQNVETPYSNRQVNTRMSALGRLNYTFNKKYLFTLSYRADGSSKFLNHKWGFFPSAALAWQLGEEAFMKNINTVISTAKLRVSTGATGNDRIPTDVAYSYASSADYGNGGTIDKGFAPLYEASSDLKWETTWQHDVGVDLGFLEDRINITADVYYKKTSDLLLYANVTGVSGQAKQWQNIGAVENKGLELSLNTINIDKKKFQWSSNINITFNQNKILDLGGVDEIPFLIPGGYMTDMGRLIVGESIGTAYGYVFDGVYQTDDFTSDGALKEGVVSMAGRNVQPGDFKYKDLDGDGVVNSSNDKTVISQSVPQHYGGFSNTFKYGGFDLSLLFRWSYGNDVYNAGRFRYEGGLGVQHINNVTQEYWENRWTEDNASNTHGKLGNAGAKDISSYYVEDASFIRLQNISLGYTFSGPFLETMNVKNIRVYGVADNLFVWTEYSGYDPEVSFNNTVMTGLDRIGYPRATTITLGVNVNL